MMNTSNSFITKCEMFLQGCFRGISFTAYHNSLSLMGLTAAEQVQYWKGVRFGVQ
jgi:hypothetical protein